MATATATAATERPTSLAETRELLRDTSGALLFRGAGTKLQWGAPPERVDLVVETGGLDRIVAHDAEDATAVVEAGVPLRRFQQEVRGAGQWLAIDPPDDGATVGGILAANDAGPRRQRYGGMRDLVIGTTVVLSDGTVGRSGGKVIKNVAGYDLGKVLCGSLGTLGLVTEIVVRLHPIPAASATVRAPADASTASTLTLDLLASPIVATAIDWAEGALWVRVEGHPAAVDAQSAAVRDLATRHDVDGVEVLTDGDEAAAWQRHIAALSGGDGETVVRAGTLPSHLPRVAGALEAAAADAGVTAQLSSHTGLGLHTARLRDGDPSAHAEAVRGWRRRVRDLGGYAVVRRRVPGADVDAWGDPPPGLEVMRRLKERFDPARRCAPGRFVGGL